MRGKLHNLITKAISMIAFSFLGVIAGVLLSIFGSVTGIVYQLFKVLWITLKVLCGFDDKADN